MSRFTFKRITFSDNDDENLATEGCEKSKDRVLNLGIASTVAGVGSLGSGFYHQYKANHDKINVKKEHEILTDKELTNIVTKYKDNAVEARKTITTLNILEPTDKNIALVDKFKKEVKGLFKPDAVTLSLPEPTNGHWTVKDISEFKKKLEINFSEENLRSFRMMCRDVYPERVRKLLNEEESALWKEHVFRRINKQNNLKLAKWEKGFGKGLLGLGATLGLGKIAYNKYKDGKNNSGK